MRSGTGLFREKRGHRCKVVGSIIISTGQPVVSSATHSMAGRLLTSWKAFGGLSAESAHTYSCPLAFPSFFTYPFSTQENQIYFALFLVVLLFYFVSLLFFNSALLCCLFFAALLNYCFLFCHQIQLFSHF